MGNLCSPRPDQENTSSTTPPKDNTKTQGKPNSSFEQNGPSGKKLLLVGAGDSGKSTIFKQLKRLYTTGFTRDELNGAIPYILENIMRNMIQLCHATISLQIPIKTENIERRDRYADMMKNQRAPMQAQKLWNNDMAQDFKSLWNDEGIRKAFSEYRTNFMVEDSVSYYFDKLDEIGKPDWFPTEEDLLRTRIKTTGLRKPFTMIDVGGQRTERKKWIGHFENVDAILYICSLSEFDQKCYEDEITNRMKESLELFASYINSKYFEGSLIYLVLNKQDIFVDKINRGVNLKDTFEDYNGSPKDTEAAKNFIEGMYRDQDQFDRLRGVLYLNALDKDCLKEKLDEIVQDIINAEIEI